MTPPLWSSTDGQAQASWTFPVDADHLLFEAREIIDWQYDGPLPRGQGAHIETPVYKTYRLSGDGSMVIETPRYARDLPKLSPEAIEQLLRIVDRLMDLPAAQRVDPPPAHGPYVAVHLDRYISADWQDAVDFLDAIVVDPPEVIFEELSALHRWLLSTSGQAFWASSTPWICQKHWRAEHKLDDLSSTWCQWLSKQGSVTFRGDPGKDVDDDARDRVRERLRQRLRELPRGLQAQDPQEDEP